MLDKININIIKISQDLTPWILRQTNRLQYLWSKNKPLQDQLEKWDRFIVDSTADAKFNSQTLSFQGYVSKKMSDFYKIYPLQSSVNGVSGYTYNSSLLGFTASGSTNVRTDIKINDVLSRGFVDATKIRLSCYLQPTLNNRTPYVALFDGSDFVSDFIGLDGGYNDVVLTFNDNSPSGSTYVSFIIQSGQSYIVSDLGIYYEKVSDALISLNPRELNEFIIYNDAYIINQPFTTEYPLFMDDDNGYYDLSVSGVTNFTSVYTGFTDHVFNFSGVTGAGTSSVMFKLGVLYDDVPDLFMTYGDLRLTGNTDVRFQIGYLSGSNYVMLEQQKIYTYLPSDIINFDNKGVNISYDSYNIPMPFTTAFDTSTSILESNSNGVDLITFYMYFTGVENNFVSINTSGWSGNYDWYAYDSEDNLLSTYNSGSGNWDFYLGSSPEFYIVLNVGWGGDFYGVIRPFYMSPYSGVNKEVVVRLVFDSSVSFGFDFMIGSTTGILYNDRENEVDGGVVIYIDDKDYLTSLIKYIDKVISFKKPVGVSYRIESF